MRDVFQAEADRIVIEYRRRARDLPADYYSVSKPDVLFANQQRARKVIRLLDRLGMFPLDSRRILEIGCGRGGWIADFESWGAQRKNLAGIELDPERGAFARARFAAERRSDGQVLSPGADIRIGDASELPWNDQSFDLVVQSTVFTSILSDAVRRKIAREMLRVVKSSGTIIWYDFFYDNPQNPNVRGIGGREIRELFSECNVALHATTLAPPIARRIVRVTWLGAAILERLRLLNTHYLGTIQKRST